MLIDLANTNLDKVFFTADNHFGHANIIKFQKRPFADVVEMNVVMQNRWNEIVPLDGVVFHLGDFTLERGSIAEQWFAGLNGTIKILSNPWHHDRRWLETTAPPYESYGHVPVELLPPMVVLEVPQLGKSIDGKTFSHAITLCHYPVAEWDRKHYKAWHLHGHSHGAYQYKDDEFALDVGVDCWNYYPVSFNAVWERMCAMNW